METQVRQYRQYRIKAVQAMFVLALSLPTFLSIPAKAALSGQIQTEVGADAAGEAVANKAMASTVKLTMMDSNGRIAATGSGFFVAADLVVTNYHVIRGMGSGYAKFADSKEKYSIVRVVAADPVTDLAVLYVPGTGATALGLKGDIAIGEAVYVAGSPLGLDGTFSAGVLSAIRENGDLQVTASISPGNSGGPVLDERGNVIGIVEYTIPAGQNLNFAIPISRLQDLLKTIS
jgi:S1-C subfamily serine protease